MQRVAGPLLLLTATTALAAFSASLALTLDRHLIARTYYQVGADLRLRGAGRACVAARQHRFGARSAGQRRWRVGLPAHRRAPSCPASKGRRASPTTAPRPRWAGRTEVGRYLGIDRLDLPGVVTFQDGFASQPLGALLNALAAERRGVLVERRSVRHSLAVGDPLRLTIDVLGERVELTTVVVGRLTTSPRFTLRMAPSSSAISRLSSRTWGAFTPTTSGWRPSQEAPTPLSGRSTRAVYPSSAPGTPAPASWPRSSNPGAKAFSAC